MMIWYLIGLWGRCKMDIMIAKNSGMHDYKFEKIMVDYEKNIVYILFKDLSENACELIIKNMISIELTHEEKWGKGTYICYSNVLEDQNISILEFELNSGDQITIRFCS